MKYFIENSIIHIVDIKCLSLPLTLDCGQAFRWKENEDGSWSGVAKDHYLNIRQENGEYYLSGTDEKTFKEFWINYFDLNRDYEKICNVLKEDEQIKDTIEKYYGIRILKQDPWEALCSFLISQQNNIKRIKGIVEKLCLKYGKEVSEGFYSFPDPNTLSKLSLSDFEELGLGYRAKYLEKLSKDVANGNIDLEGIKEMNLEEARNALLEIYGVGVKVADCALLFGFGFLRAFPIDVWMKRVMEYYPSGLPKCFEGYEGIAQQYLFHWARNNLGDK